MNKRTKHESRNVPIGKETSEYKALNLKADKLISQLDLCLNILLEILFSNPQYVDEVPYTDKVVYLRAQGIESSSDISRIVGRPSKSISTRFKESKTRNKQKRKRLNTLPLGSTTARDKKRAP